MHRIIRRNQQAGFTLIEIAIVLIIIGLLLGGVLKGQTLVKNSKIKRMAADSQAFVAATNAYIDSYWALPGDDGSAGTRWSAQAIVAGDANGTIGAGGASADAVFTAVKSDSEGFENAKAVVHLRCAELLNGTCAVSATTTLPRNALGGIIGIDDGSGVEDDMLGLKSKVICQSNIESDYAMIYDTQFDDGIGSSGMIVGSTQAQQTAGVFDTTSAATDYTAGQIIFVCSGF